MKFLIVFLSYFTLCNSLIYSQQKDTSEVWHLKQKAIELYEAYKYDSAAHYYFQVAEICEQQKSWINSVKYFRLTANSFNLINKSDTALYFIQKALNITNNYFIKNTKNENFKKADAYVTLGDIHLKLGKYNKGLQCYENALNLVLHTDSLEKLKVANIWNCIGETYSHKGNYDIAETYLKKSLQTKTQILGENHPDLFTCYNNLGHAYLFMEHFDKALEYYQKAIQINLNGKNSYSLLLCHVNISVAYRYKGDFDKSFEYCQNALNLSNSANENDLSYTVVSYNNLGNHYRNKGDYDKALEYYTKVLKIKIPTKLVQNGFISKIYNNLGMVYSHKGDHNKAVEYYQKALKIRKNIVGEQHPFLANSYIKIALESESKNDFKESLEYYQKALIANVLDFYDTNIYHNPKELNTFSKPELLYTLIGKANSLYFLYKIESKDIKDIKTSISTYELVFKLIHEIRNDYIHEKTKLLISKETKRYLTQAILGALELYKVDPSIENKARIFEYIEKSKSTTLSNYLNDLKIKQYWNIADSLIHIEKDIAINRSNYETKIQLFRTKINDFDTLLIKIYQDSLFNYSRQHEEMINILKLNYPEYFSLKYKQETAEIKDIQNELDNNSALINYFVGDTSLFICSITKEEYTIKVIKTDSLFNEKLLDYYIDIKSGFTEKELKSSTYLYNYLIEPIKEELKNKNNIIIIPDGNLYYIPFETLCRNDTYTDDLSTINYLIKDYSVTYHHTATLWLSSKEKEQNELAAKDNFIGFAPVFNPKINNGFIVSNEWILDTTNTDLASRSISSDLTHFNALPYSENEVESIVRLFNKKRKNAKAFFYKEANEDNFKNNIQNYKYIHIASHSFTNDLYPNLSGIAFSQPDTGTNYNEDGILYAGETYNLNLPKANLITLSSCKSGLGKLIQGEGFLSLSRGFLYSGTPNIIFSLWNVKDEPTKDLMIDFYKHILQGTAYASALRKAKLNLISNPETAEPKYWGAWMLVGR